MVKEQAHLCKCNNCGTVMIDQNPQINGTLHELKGNEVEMQYVPALIETTIQEKEYFWACPICLTDDYLNDL